MKKALLILACTAIAGCCDYEHHPDVLAATRDPLFIQWLSRNDLVVSSFARGYDCSIIYVRRLETAASAPRNALVRYDDAAEAPAPTPPRAERVKRPFAESGDDRSGNGANNGDDDGFHADIVPQKQEARQ